MEIRQPIHIVKNVKHSLERIPRLNNLWVKKLGVTHGSNGLSAEARNRGRITQEESVENHPRKGPVENPANGVGPLDVHGRWTAYLRFFFTNRNTDSLD